MSISTFVVPVMEMRSALAKSKGVVDIYYCPFRKATRSDYLQNKGVIVVYMLLLRWLACELFDWFAV